MTLDLRRNFVSAQYLENYLTYFHQILYAFILTRSSLGLLHVIFPNFKPELWPFIIRKKFVSAQYLENQLVEFHQILYMQLPWQDLPWDCYA